jgi:sarcosine oxidase subunit gamma
MMTMESLVERNALSGVQPIDIAGRLTIAPAPDCARFSLRVGDAGRPQAGAAFGCQLPPKIGGLEQSDGRTVLCVGPDEWLLLAPIAESDTIEERFRSVQAPLSLVDIGNREVGIEVSGPSATLVLSSSSPLDLPSMAVRTGARTIFDKAQVVLIKVAADHYRLEVWQSFAPHVWAFLASVSREIELDI